MPQTALSKLSNKLSAHVTAVIARHDDVPTNLSAGSGLSAWSMTGSSLSSAAIEELLSRPVDYLEVETGAGARAARQIAELL